MRLHNGGSLLKNLNHSKKMKSFMGYTRLLFKIGANTCGMFEILPLKLRVYSHLVSSFQFYRQEAETLPKVNPTNNLFNKCNM